MFLFEYLWFVIGHLSRIIWDLLAIILSPIIFIKYYLDRGCIKKRNFKSILITGGTSGIGKELAIQFANKNTILIITGRKQKSLNKLRNELSDCKQLILKEIDVRNNDLMKLFIYDMIDKYKCDLIIANAGVGLTTLNEPFYPHASKSIIDTNVYGVLNTILPSIAKYQDFNKNNKSIIKHICVIGSVGSYIPYSLGGCYNGSKSCIRFICDDLRPQLKHWNIDLTLVNPGRVNSKMCPESHNKNEFGFLNTKKACNIIINNLKLNKHEINFPNKVFTLAWLCGTLHPIIRYLTFGKYVFKFSDSLRFMNIGRRQDMSVGDDECYH